MKKRNGVTLVTIIIVILFVIVLGSALMNTYLSSVKQNVYTRNTDQADYTALSGLSAMTTYITQKNDEFASKYPTAFSSDSNGYYLEIPVTSETGTTTYYTNVYVLVINESDDITKYKLTSKAIVDSYDSEIDVTITKDTSTGIAYTMGNYNYK